MGRLAVVLVLGISLSAAVMGPTLVRSGTEATERFAQDVREAQARSNARSAVQVCLMEIFRDRDWNIGMQDVPFSGGALNVAVETVEADGRLVVRGSGSYGDADHDASAVVSLGSLPSPLRAAFTSAGDVRVGGSAVVDARNHDAQGNLLEGSGTKAISTLGAVTQDLTAGIGGMGLLPQFPAAGGSLEELTEWPDAGGFPADPAAVLDAAEYGVDLAALKAIAQSGANGSQFATSVGSLHLPLRGVTYIEYDGDAWIPPMDYGDNAGLMIFHGPTGNARIVNDATSHFRGLVIADQYTRRRGGVIGGVVTLNPSETSSFEGSAELLFSREAIEEAIGAVPGLEVRTFEVGSYNDAPRTGGRVLPQS